MHQRSFYLQDHKPSLCQILQMAYVTDVLDYGNQQSVISIFLVAHMSKIDEDDVEQRIFNVQSNYTATLQLHVVSPYSHQYQLNDLHYSTSADISRHTANYQAECSELKTEKGIKYAPQGIRQSLSLVWMFLVYDLTSVNKMVVRTDREHTPTTIHIESTIINHHRPSGIQFDASTYRQPSNICHELKKPVAQLNKRTFHSSLFSGLLKRLVYATYYTIISTNHD